MALPADVISWLSEDDDSADAVEFFVIISRVFTRLQERRASQNEIDRVFRSLAPLEFHARHVDSTPWGCFFAPKIETEESHGEYPNLAKLNSENVNEWADLAEFLKQPHIKARFADAVWELGRRIGSTRKDLYRFGRLAAEMYLEVAVGECKHPFEILNAATRGIQLATQLGARDLLDQGYEFLIQYAESVAQAHVGLWSAPFDRLLGLNGLSEAQRDRILDHHEKRFVATVSSGDIFRMTVAGPKFAKYFYDHQEYQRAKDVTFAYGEAILKSAVSLDASLASHHIGVVLEDYRRVGLKEEADRVRLLLEEKAKGALAGMKSRRIEFKLDAEAIEKVIIETISVSNPLVALYRLVNSCSPTPEAVEARFEAVTEGLIFHRLLPVSIVSDDGLTVTTIGTYDQDKEGRLVMEMAREMDLNAMFFLSGIEEWKKRFGLGGIPDTPFFFDSPLIPADRVSLFREGLLAFECEDYVKCIHVLVFQVENSLRELLRMLNLPVSKSTDDGYELKNMNDVLHDPIVKDALEPKLWCFLKVLYADKRGINLRNIVAHGMAPGNTFNKVNAALVIQSVVFLTMIRHDTAYVVGEPLAAERHPDAVPRTGQEEIEASEDASEKDGREILAASDQPVV